MTALEFPIQIGLIGAPGAGKQALAAEFQKISADWFEANNSPLNLVENAGNVIEREFDAAMAQFGSWEEDLRAFYNRVDREDKLRVEGKSFISLGTSVEHLAHCGTNLETVFMGIQTPEQLQRVEQYKVGMMTLTFLFTQGFRYIFGFYLPHPATALVVPGMDQTDSNYGKRVDNGIRQIFGNFGLRIQMLDQPTVEEKALEMFSTIKDIVENGPPSQEELESSEKIPEFTLEERDAETEVPTLEALTAVE